MFYRKVRYRIISKMVFAVAFILFRMQANATTYYSRSSGANWNVNASWSTVTYAGAAASSYPVAGDTVNIANGITVMVNTSSACSVINIGQGTSGILQFGSTGNFTLTVSGKIVVNSGARLYYNSNSARKHTLKLAGNLVNNGIVDLYYDNDDYVNITFDQASNSIVSGTGTWALNDVTLNKSSSSVYLEIQCTGFEAAIGSLATSVGTYIHNNSSSYSINSSSASNFVISETVVFKVPQGTVWFSPNASTCYLEGSLYVNGGAVKVGATTGTNGLIYRQPGSFIPYLEISSGSFDAYGGIFNNSSDPFSFKMTGGSMLLNNGSSGTSQGIFYQNDLTGSVFYMSGGTIVIEDHNKNGGTNVDWAVCGTNGIVTVTGGTVQFGNNSTPANTTFDFMPFPNVVQPNIKITGPSGSVIALQPTKSSIEDFQFLSLYIDVNKTFDIRSILGTPGNTKKMTLTSTYDGVHAFYNDGTFAPQNGTVAFSGTTSQDIGGSSIMTLYNLTMSSSFNLTLEKTLQVSNVLTMTSGKIITTSANILICTSTASSNIGSASSYVDGPMKHTIASSALASRNFPIGKGSSYRPAVLNVTHSNSTSVTYEGEVMNVAASSLMYNLPPTLSTVSVVRYWNFTRQNVANYSSGSMKLYYDVDDSVSNKLRVSVVHDDGSGNWLDLGGTGTANYTGNITSNNISSFKTKFALGFPPSLLPITLISFNVKKINSQVRCEWTTASEINNDYFTLERSTDNNRYVPFLKIKGAGNSTTAIHYAALDEFPLAGGSYYRLKQTDYDGRFSYSEPVYVNLENDASPYKIFPNPSNGELVHIIKNGEDMSDAVIVVEDLQGREVSSSSSFSNDKKEIQLTIDPSSYTNENYYFVSVCTGKERVKNKIFVNKN